MKIGILDQTCVGWSGGASYTRALLASLSLAKAHCPSPHSRGNAPLNENEQIVFLSREGKMEVPEQFQQIAFASMMPRNALADEFDVVLPVRDKVVHEIRTTKIGWIPDFQHYRLPELFALEDLAARDALFDIIASECQLVIVSSQSSRRDFEEFLQPFASKVRVLPFPSILWAAPLVDDPQSVVSKYHLPERFALVVNQFWAHKNHAVLPPAIAILKKEQTSVDLVLTGLPSDYRDVENRRLSQFFQECAQLGITEQVHFLGHVPYEDMISLMRCATLVIQPSLFEGWNTTIEDAKALGRPLICSDIPVHREQAPDALGFFEPTSAADLAHLIGSRYPQLDAGPARLAEVEALSRSKAQAAAFGRSLLSLAREAFEISTATHSDTLVPKFEPPTLAASPQEKKNQLREYLAQKKPHLRYLFGKLIFRLTYWRETIELLRNFLYELTQKSHGHELGVMRQHSGRPLRIEKFSMPKAKRLQLPTIAMVTPSYEQADALSATIDSVVKQDYPGLEYAVVDRGSRDGTEGVLTQFQSKLTFNISEADVGPAQAVLNGFARLQGEIMSCLNAGNVLMPGALSFVGEYFAAHPDVEVIYGHRIIVDEQGQEVGRWILPRHERETLRYFNYIPEETLYWRKSIYDRVGGINPTFQIAIAWDLLLRFAAAGAQIRRVPYGLACFQIRPGPKTIPAHDTIAQRERLRLLSREHPNGYTAELIQEREHWYRLRSSLCATLLKAGIRF